MFKQLKNKLTNKNKTKQTNNERKSGEQYVDKCKFQRREKKIKKETKKNSGVEKYNN